MDKNNKARLERIEQEFTKAFELFTRYDKGIVVFGSARSSVESLRYKKALSLGYRLSKLGYVVISGGGLGTMEAVNKGAYEAKGKSIGLNIRLPHEQTTNNYTTKAMTFRYFFIRKFFLTYLSKATVVLPGGWGTMDEAYEHLTLVQTNKIKLRPIIFVNKSYYKDMFNWWKNILAKNNAIDAKDIDKYVRLVDSNNDVIKILGELI